MDQILGIFSHGSGAIEVYALIVALLMAGAFGFPFPEDLLFLSVGYLAYTGIVDPVYAIVVGYVAVLISDTVVYFLGNKIGAKVCSLPILRSVITPEAIQKGKKLLHKNGPKFVFISKFIVGLRYSVFFVSGMMQIGYKRFITFDAMASAISVPTLISIAYFNGEKIDKVLVSVKRAEYSILVVAAFVLLIFLTRYYFVKKRKKVA